MHLHHLVADLAIRGEVVGAAEPVVPDPGRVRNRRVEPRLEIAADPFGLVVGAVIVR
jgi:hypothetical protein